MLAQREVGRAAVDEAELQALLISDAPPEDPLKSNLEGSALDVRQGPLGPEAISAAVESRPPMLLIDARRQARMALQLCAALRSRAEIASAFLIVILGDDNEQMRIEAFEAGADECFAEPVGKRELWSRLEAVKRRIRNAAGSDVIRYADLELDLQKHKVRRAGRLIELSTAQMRLLRFLMEHPGVVFTRQELLQGVWRDDSLDEGAVTVGVVRLRRALKSTGGPDLIRQVRGIGYSLDAELDG